MITCPQPLRLPWAPRHRAPVCYVLGLQEQGYPALKCNPCLQPSRCCEVSPASCSQLCPSAEVLHEGSEVPWWEVAPGEVSADSPAAASGWAVPPSPGWQQLRVQEVRACHCQARSFSLFFSTSILPLCSGNSEGSAFLQAAWGSPSCLKGDMREGCLPYLAAGCSGSIEGQ